MTGADSKGHVHFDALDPEAEEKRSARGQEHRKEVVVSQSVSQWVKKATFDRGSCSRKFLTFFVLADDYVQRGIKWHAESEKSVKGAY